MTHSGSSTIAGRLHIHEAGGRSFSTPQRFAPHAERLRLFETVVTLGIMLVLLFCMSVYVISLPVKAMLMLLPFCLFINRGKLLDHAVWPLLAIPLYGAAVSYVFPCWRPDVWTILERPLFSILCVLMVSVVVSSEGDWRHRLLAFGILIICLIGAVGDTLGYDMISALPFSTPDDAYFEQVTMDKFGAARVRGFFPESGVLGAVSLGIATSSALGTWALLSRRRTPGAFAALAGFVVLGAAMLVLTLTKSGLMMSASGLAGFLVFLAFSRNPACRMTALVGSVLAGLGMVALFYAPGDLGAYFQAEVGNALTLHQDSAPSGGGLATRIECWRLALYSLLYYPTGVGGWGVDNVMNRTTEVVPTAEMRFFFDRDMFGLKSGLANLVAQTGLVGVSLLGFWLWWNFLLPAFRLLKSGIFSDTLLAGLYGASAALSVFFLFSCELYPSYALLLFFKLHADAIAARVHIPWFERTVEPMLAPRLMRSAAL
jgi:hypothetical protein